MVCSVWVFCMVHGMRCLEVLYGVVCGVSRCCMVCGVRCFEVLYGVWYAVYGGVVWCMVCGVWRFCMVYGMRCMEVLYGVWCTAVCCMVCDVRPSVVFAVVLRMIFEVCDEDRVKEVGTMVKVCVCCMVCGVCMVYGVWCVYGVECTVYGVWCVVYGVWCMVYGVWCMVCGVWCILCVFNVWFMAIVYNMAWCVEWVQYGYGCGMGCIGIE